jgi:hypothetical protein
VIPGRLVELGFYGEVIAGVWREELADCPQGFNEKDSRGDPETWSRGAWILVFRETDK